jgi:V8-like Glu-specific endopeptidase
MSATVVVIASLLLALPAGAITYGTPDDGGHPHVGALVMEIDSERFLICSGTLISDDVFLTASHCTAALEQITSSDRALVTFDDQFDPVDGTFYEGTAKTNPAYSSTPMNDTGDIAVVVLDEPLHINTPVQLPPLGYLDEFNVKNGLKGQTFRNVGYGVSEPQFEPGGPQFP